MMTSDTETEMQEGELDRLLAAARAAAPPPSPALLLRIEADALREQPRPTPGPARRHGAAARRPAWQDGWLGALLGSIGGAPGAAGLAGAALAGLWIGLAQPAPLSGLTARLTGEIAGPVSLDSVELIPALDPFANEG